MYYFLMFPLLGGAIGWVTNFLAIKFLFRPRKPLKIGPVLIQGVIPRRRQELARAVGEVVATELLSREQIADALNTPEIRTGVAEMAGEAVGRRVSSYRILSTLPGGLRERIAASVDTTVTREVSAILSAGGSDMTDRLLASLDLADLVEAKLEAMDWDSMEAIVYSVSGRELKLIEVMGGVLGALVGLVQALVVYLS